MQPDASLWAKQAFDAVDNAKIKEGTAAFGKVDIMAVDRRIGSTLIPLKVRRADRRCLRHAATAAPGVAHSSDPTQVHAQ
ncbi:hypothetical protein ACWD25_05185 [Streptomyces sp. NPDC002920]